MNKDNLALSLKKIGIFRSSNTPVGKVMGNNIWVHKDYVSLLPQFVDIFDAASSVVPDNFEFDIVRFDKRGGDVCFISSPDFITSSEPIVSRTLKVNVDEFGVSLAQPPTKKQDNPLIYHHKWLFVPDSSNLFNVEESMKRSLEWKSVLGVDKTISSKIGRLDFWNTWLLKNNLTNTNNPPCNQNIKKTILKL